MESTQGLHELIRSRLIEKRGNVKLTENTDIILYGKALGINENQLLFKILEIEETIDWAKEKSNVNQSETFTASPSTNLIYCSSCHAANETGLANFCVDCGAAFKQENYQENDYSNTNDTPRNNTEKSSKYLYYILGITILVIVVLIGINLDFCKPANTLEVPYMTNPKDTIAIKTSNILNGNYAIASEKILTNDDLFNRNKYELKIMRNEIFARHGYIFKTNDMKLYFESQAWYSPKYEDVTSFLTEIEKGNIELIKRYE